MLRFKLQNNKSRNKNKNKNRRMLSSSECDKNKHYRNNIVENFY